MLYQTNGNKKQRTAQPKKAKEQSLPCIFSDDVEPYRRTFGRVAWYLLPGTITHFVVYIVGIFYILPLLSAEMVGNILFSSALPIDLFAQLIPQPAEQGLFDSPDFSSHESAGVFPTYSEAKELSPLLVSYPLVRPPSRRRIIARKVQPPWLVGVLAVS